MIISKNGDNMKLNIFIISIILFYCGAISASAAPRTVAVMDFSNNTGGKGLQYMSKSLPESISATLSQSKDVRVVEREHLGKLLDEIALGQTGVLDDSQVSRAGKMAKADVLIIGSYSGNPENIVLSIKAVDVASAKVIDGKVIKAPLSGIFDRANQAALAMAALIAGKKIGYLNVASTPDGADIYVDGMEIGKSPIIEYKLAEGSYSLKAVKSGHIESETTINIGQNRHEKWSPFLVKDVIKDRWEIGLNFMYFMPADTKLKGAPLFIFFMGHSFDLFVLTAEMSYTRPGHDQKIDSVFGDITQARYYSFFTIYGHLSIIPFHWKYLQPYAGIFAGWNRIADYRKVGNSEERLMLANLFGMGAKVGANIFPFSRVSLFAEGRFYYTPTRIKRKEYSSQGIFGDLKSNDTKIYFNAFSVGGGIKFFF